MVRLWPGIITVLAVSVLLCGCIEESAPELRSYDCFFAAIEEDEDATRAHFEQSIVKWDNQDAIGVYSDTQTSPKVFTRNSSGSFTGDAVSGSTFYAYFPSSGFRASSTSHYVTFDSPAPAFDKNKINMPMVAYGSGNNLSFKQTCSVLHFFLKASESYDTITLKGNSGENIAGTGRVSVNSNNPVFSITGNSAKEIVAQVPSGVNWKTGVDVYFVLPPVHFYSGFTLTVENGSRSLSKSTSKEVSNSRQKMTRYELNLDDLIDTNVEPEIVDLGLSVKWASCNLGATKPEDYGNYFAWGETAPKNNYSWASYKHGRGDYSALTKYSVISSYGTLDNKTVLDPEDDAATVILGGNWRMPTKTEMEELRDNCTWTWTTLKGVNGYQITSNKTGFTTQSIFLPAAGDMQGTTLSYAGSYGNYWSSSLREEDCRDAWAFDFGQSDYSVAIYGNRYYGFPIRPVCSGSDDYSFFLGTWNVPRGSDYDTWVIAPYEYGSTYFVKGIDGHDDVMVATFDSSIPALLLHTSKEFKNTTVTYDNKQYDAKASLYGFVYMSDKEKEVCITGQYVILGAFRLASDTMRLFPNSISVQGYDSPFDIASFGYIFDFVVNNESWTQWHSYRTQLPCDATRVSANYAPKAGRISTPIVTVPNKGIRLKYEND